MSTDNVEWLRGYATCRAAPADARLQSIANELAELRKENERLHELGRWLKEREEWLTKEAHSGGNWEHLNARRSECAYIRDRLAIIAAAKASKEKES